MKHRRRDKPPNNAIPTVTVVEMSLSPTDGFGLRDGMDGGSDATMEIGLAANVGHEDGIIDGKCSSRGALCGTKVGTAVGFLKTLSAGDAVGIAGVVDGADENDGDTEGA